MAGFALDAEMLPLLAGIAVAAALLLFAFGLSQAVAARNDKLRRKLKSVQVRWQPVAAGDTKTERIDNNADQSRFNLMLRRLVPRRERLVARLEQTGLEIGVVGYAIFCILLTALVLAIAMLVFQRSFITALPLALGTGVGTPHWLIGVLGQRRIAKFLQMFPEAIDLIVRGLKSGLPIQESISNVAQEIPNPVGIEFRRIDAAVKVGVPLEDALWNSARRIDSADYKFFVISLSVQRETGGNLAEALHNLADILRRRRQMRLKIKAMSSEARASAYIIGSLPFIMFGLLLAVNSKYVLQLFSDPRGMVMVGIGLFSMFLGCIVMFKMVRFEI